MGTMWKWVLRATAAALVAGCGTEPGREAEGEAGGETVSGAGANLNGANLNGANLNGASLNGVGLDEMLPGGKVVRRTLLSVSYEGARRGSGGQAVERVRLEGGALHGAQGRRELSGRDFRGVSFNGNLSTGETLALRVEEARLEEGVWTYDVSYLHARDGRWRPLCGTSRGEPVGAIAVEGRWDYRQGERGGGSKVEDPSAFTFACDGAAIAKCVRYGYRPWEGLAAHHQACTRLIRADFCGDGTPYTVDGQWVNLYDDVGTQRDTEAWVTEAEWDEHGARCLVSQMRARRPIQCADGRVRPACDAARAFKSGALLVSETPPLGGRGHFPFHGQ
ncbi:ADYC domain-containing protein [Myxococcaceae bacterium GXIMD 01537]